ncbi:MAG: trimeric intracellular cation channel family protein [Lachnospiraceae bacterium]|nr:trimeric intracellular cation channel family protein [Lachnospiraceae bacterium]
MLNKVIFVIEFCGTIYYAISGSMVAIEKKMDVFGVAILAVTTSVGGGILRDIILGKVPPTAFVDPIFVIEAVIVALILFPKKVRRRIKDKRSIFYSPLLWMDTIGLGIFTVVGVSTAIELGYDNPFLLIGVGVITAVGGGVMRDCMANNLPFIFVKEVYATAALSGAIVCTLLWDITGSLVAMIAGAGTVILLRNLSHRYRWKLPNAKI